MKHRSRPGTLLLVLNCHAGLFDFMYPAEDCFSASVLLPFTGTMMSRKIKLILANLIMLLVFLEIAALSLFFIRNHEFFYARKNSNFAGTLRNLAPGRQLPDIRFHPFFGYTKPPNRAGVNNFGFTCQPSLPYIKKKQDVVIGIFGGSVAEGFYQNGRDSLARELRKKEIFRDKDFVFLNFALGGF
jgi:hypothetical protein